MIYIVIGIIAVLGILMAGMLIYRNNRVKIEAAKDKAASEVEKGRQKIKEVGEAIKK